jgi:AraC-like DNA-binding protein
MSLHAALFALDGIIVFLSLLLAACLVIARPRSAAPWIAALILINSAGYVLFTRGIYGFWIPEPYQLHLPAGVTLTLQVMMNTTPGLFMLLCFVLFREGSRRFPPWLLILFAVQVALEDLVPGIFGITTRPSVEPVMTDTHAGWHLLFETLPAVLQTLFIGAALYWTVDEWRADLVEGRRRLRGLLMAVIGISGTGIVASVLLGRIVVPEGSLTGFYVNEVYMSLALVAYVLLIVSLVRAAPVAPVEQVVPAAAPPPEDAPTDLDYQAFQQAMRDGAYQQPGLTVAGLARHLHVPEYRLRRLINRRLGYRNFNHMLHTYRVGDAKRMLADMGQRDLPILSIALSLGYQSINPFNRAFRDLTGLTPSAFREKALGGSGSTELRPDDPMATRVDAAG